MSDDLISRREAIDALCKVGCGSGHCGISCDDVQAIEQLPSAQPTLYGYKIEHLAYIAMVMEKEGVTADYAVRTFDDMSRVIKMIIDVTRQKVEEALNE